MLNSSIVNRDVHDKNIPRVVQIRRTKHSYGEHKREHTNEKTVSKNLKCADAAYASSLTDVKESLSAHKQFCCVVQNSRG